MTRGLKVTLQRKREYDNRGNDLVDQLEIYQAISKGNRIDEQTKMHDHTKTSLRSHC